MPASRRIIVTVPENLLCEVDDITALESINRSELVRVALKFYLGEYKKQLLMEQMKKGYLEMAEINLCIANENLGADDESFK